jgi:hypothetical protein
MQLSALGLALNPCARITVQGGVEPPLFLVEAPIRGAQFSARTVSAEQLPQAHDFLVAALVRGERVEQVSADAIAELQQIGLLADRDALPKHVHYNLFGHGSASGAAAMDELQAAGMLGEPLRSRGFRLPEQWASEQLKFQPHHHASIWAPVLVDGPSAYPIEKPAAPVALDAPATCDFFSREGFAELSDLLPKTHVAELGRYFQALATEGFMSRDDDRGSRRFFAHNHPVANFWHDQLNERVSQLVGCRTKPSYTFASIYLEGGELEWHTDRPPCEYTITLLIDCAPLDTEGRSPWALKVKGRDGRIHAIHQRIGDALLFKGRELEHSRDVLPSGQHSSSLLFHFVDADYEGEMT